MHKGNEGDTSALYVWNGFSLFWGTSFRTDPHLHNTLQLVFDIDRCFKLKDATSDWTAYPAAIIRDGHLHQLDSCGSIQLFIYLDRDSHYAKELGNRYLSRSGIAGLHHPKLSCLSTKFFKELLVKSDCETLLKGCQFILQTLLDSPPPKALDDRIKRAIAYIGNAPDKQFKVKAIADHICLSESRLRHLFKEQIGQPIQNFVLWMKVVDSLNLVLKGRPIGQTALDTGFWDSSHMNRSYKELLGVAPGKIKAFEKELKIVACGRGNLHLLRTEITTSWDPNQIKKTIEI
ncbi:helix-turn-helix domain-containing protein [Flavobacteriaceae bacterium 3-367]|uniref:helix-turn-helix domain-containing protein n=1 Tax=Eudoraea algarum TaxID=3417568 RepID=UPI003295241D